MANPIKSARRAQKMTQDELAQKLACNYDLKINRATLSKYESGKIEPPVKHLKKIAAALNLSSWTDLVPEEQRETVIIDHMLNVLSNKKKFTQLSEAEAVKQFNFNFKSNENRLLFAFGYLNEEGQQKAIERVEELTEIPKYQRKAAPSDTTAEAPEDE